MSASSSPYPLRAEIILASDVHLVAMDDKNATLLLGMLAEVERGDVEYLVFLGDIFDFVLGTSAYFQKKLQPLAEALARVAAKGTRVIYLEGNHEFSITGLAWPFVTWVPEGDYTLTTRHGETVKLAHGDMIYSSQTYKRFRAVVKSPFVRHAARFFPGRLIDRLATKSSDLSRAQDKYRVIDHEAILAAANAWADSSPCDHGIFGHFHVPYAEPRRGRAGKLLSVDCWDKPNFLMLREGQFHRLFLREPGEAPEMVVAQAIITKDLAGAV